jgi:hypothetical protein
MDVKMNAYPAVDALNNPTTSWAGALAGSALFVLAGLMLVLSEIPIEWGWQRFNSLYGAILLIFLILPPTFFAAGWIKGFPAWSYPYIAHALQWSFYMTQVATPGLRIFNYTFGPRDLWGWRAWIPFLIATGIALLVTRSFSPLLKLIKDENQDWTRYTFGMFGFVPLMVLISFDEMDRLYSLYFMLLLAVVMPVTALVYLRSRTTRGRAFALFAGIFFSAAVFTAAPILYWLQNGWVSVPGSILMGLSFLLVSFLPALIAWIHKKAGLDQYST